MARKSGDGGTAAQAEIITRSIAAIRFLVAPGAHTISELATRLGVSKRQAYRYVDALVEAGVAVEHEARTPDYSIRPATVRRMFGL